jgi:hypothetical protein
LPRSQVGDLTYADTYATCNFTNNFAQWLEPSGVLATYAQPGSNCQLRWDSFLAVPGTRSLFSSALVMGNHEIEKADVSYVTPTPDSPLAFNAADPGYQSWAARFPAGVQTDGTYGSINSQMYYSQVW